MKVAIVHRYFWPLEYPYAQMLKDIAETVKGSGHDVSVLSTSDGSEEEKLQRKNWTQDNNVHIYELKLGTEKNQGLIRKSFNAFYYGAWLFLSLLFQRNDVVMVATTPPVIAAAIVRWAAYLRRFKYIYHCQDIHPEAMLLNSNIRQGILYGLLLKLDTKNINQAWKVITLSTDMKSTFKKRGCRVDHIEVINNFAYNTEETEVNVCINSQRIQFLFAGNLGRFQNLELLLEAIIKFRDRDNVEFVFMGSGVLQNKISETVAKNHLSNVKILGQRSVQEAVAAMQNADIGIVSVAPRICEVAYPSKAVMYMGNGLPILALVEDDTDLSRFINVNKIGVTALPSSSDEIEKGIDRAIKACEEHSFSKEHIKKISSDHFSKLNVLNKISRLFQSE